MNRTSFPLSEILAALSLATDAGNGFPAEKTLRNTLLAMGIAGELGFDDRERSDLYQASLLRFIGCTAFTYDAETERDALRMTIDALGLGRADFAGWSGGGRALVEFALAYPERVRSLTLVEPAAYWVLEQLGGSDPDVDQINKFIHDLAGSDVTEDDLAAFLELAGFVASRTDARDHPNWERWVPHRMALSWQSKDLDRSGRSIDELATIDCPVLLVKGTVTGDWEKRVVDELGARIPKARVVELPGDHACHIQSIDRFLSELEAHLKA